MKGHSLIGAKILGNSKPSSQARQYQIGTVISQLPDLSEPASQSEHDAELPLVARTGMSCGNIACRKAVVHQVDSTSATELILADHCSDSTY
jgi:hypothetical protein